MNNNVPFLPILFVKYPVKKPPRRPPTHNRATTHDASSALIFPEGKGDSSDASNNKFGDAHPIPIPYPIDRRFAEK